MTNRTGHVTNQLWFLYKLKLYMYVRNVDYPTDLPIIFADNCLYIIDWCCCSSTINSFIFFFNFLLHASFVHNITDRELYRYSFTPGHHKCFLINIVFYKMWFYCFVSDHNNIILHYYFTSYL